MTTTFGRSLTLLVATVTAKLAIFIVQRNHCSLSRNQACVTDKHFALHWRAWYFFSCDLTYIIVCGQDHSKDCCASLPFAGDSVSVLSLWHKRAPKSSYKKCRFAAFLRCVRTAAGLAHAKIHLRITHMTRPTASKVKHTCGPGNKARIAVGGFRERSVSMLYLAFQSLTFGCGYAGHPLRPLLIHLWPVSVWLKR